jgi:hypothetical protein
MEMRPEGLSADALQAIVKAVRVGVREDLILAGLVPDVDPEMGQRWEGGELVLRPGKTTAQEKSIPLDSFFKKIVMARERLRVLEQKINNHPKLDDADRIELQAYITRIYGSFTTFNVLFAEKDDWFVGMGGEK